MADTAALAAEAAEALSSADIERVEEFTREPILLEGETPADVIPGTARRLAVDAALGEIADGRREPLDEVAPGLLAAARPRAGAGRGPADPERRRHPERAPGRRALGHPRRALGRDRGPRLERPRRRQRGRQRQRDQRARRDARRPAADADEEEDEDEESDEVGEDEEPQDWEESPTRRTRTSSPSHEDPGANRRFWFEHATGAGKTVAAVGFVDASRTGGILILTHRRNLVDQFIGEISDRGYKDRLSPAAARRLRPPLRPGHGRDLPVVRPQRRQRLRRLLDRDLRRGPHRARREDLRPASATGSARSSSA